MLASRLGYEAVKALLDGKGNIAIGIGNNKVVYTPFSEAIACVKPLDEELVKMAEILGL